MTKHVNPEDLTRDQLIDLVLEQRAKLDALTADVNQSVFNMQRFLGLSAQEARLLLALADGNARSKPQLMDAVYWERVAEDDVPELKIVDVFVCKIRKKIVGSGIGIETLWGTGYRATGVDILAKVFAGEAPTWDAGVTPVHVGRPAGYSLKRPYGAVRDAVLDFIRSKAGNDGVARFTSREMIRVVQPLGHSLSTYFAQLEKYGQIKVDRSAGRHLKGAPWVVRLAA